jgi:diguanylate cyclase (GGDEF)-like protein
MTTKKKRIMVADPQVLSQATLIGTLKTDYQVITAKSAREVQQNLKTTAIDMLLLETSLADGDGFDLCQKLKADEQTSALPIIFVTSRVSVAAEARAFEVGAVDFITKPFNAPTVLARIKIQLKLSAAISELRRLNQLALDANPNTGLPGNNSIRHELQRVLTEGEAVTVIYADLDNFKVYNDVYGFAQGDNLIIFTANVIRVSLHLAGCGESFLGHIGGDDFVIVVPADKCCLVADEIIRRIDKGIGEFYSAEDLARGSVIASDREGNQKAYKFVSISLGAVDLTRRKFSTPLEIIDVCTETKRAAKARPGSHLFLDQRRDD